MHLAHFDRQEFIEHRWDWNRGEHSFFCEPTQQGKSHLIWQLAGKVLDDYEADRRFSFAALMPKPADPATRQWMARLGLAETPAWPPAPRWPWRERPRGHVVWPKHDPALDVEVNWRQVAGPMKTCMQRQYWAGNSLTIGDDSHILAVLMGLNPQIEQHLTAGGASIARCGWPTRSHRAASRQGP